jgi:hypothetical protein
MKSINFQDDSQLWDVVILDDQGEWKTLESALSYKEADDEVDNYSDKFPHAMVDLVPHVSKLQSDIIPF